MYIRQFKLDILGHPVLGSFEYTEPVWTKIPISWAENLSSFKSCNNSKHFLLCALWKVADFISKWLKHPLLCHSIQWLWFESLHGCYCYWTIHNWTFKLELFLMFLLMINPIADWNPWPDNCGVSRLPLYHSRLPEAPRNWYVLNFTEICCEFSKQFSIKFNFLLLIILTVYFIKIIA